MMDIFKTGDVVKIKNKFFNEDIRKEWWKISEISPGGAIVSIYPLNPKTSLRPRDVWFDDIEKIQNSPSPFELFYDGHF